MVSDHWGMLLLSWVLLSHLSIEHCRGTACAPIPARTVRTFQVQTVATQDACVALQERMHPALQAKEAEANRRFREHATGRYVQRTTTFQCVPEATAAGLLRPRE